MRTFPRLMRGRHPAEHEQCPADTVIGVQR